MKQRIVIVILVVLSPIGVPIVLLGMLAAFANAFFLAGYSYWRQK